MITEPTVNEMELYIELVDGNPINHPILKSSLKAIGIDMNNIPPNYARFVRRIPVHGVYERMKLVEYVLYDGIYTDKYEYRSLTEEEKQEKQQQVKSEWAAGGHPSWIWDEENCKFNPPIPKPADAEGSFWSWNEESGIWEDLLKPEQPLSSVDYSKLPETDNFSPKTGPKFT